VSALRWSFAAIALAALLFGLVRCASQRLLYPAPLLAGRGDVALGPRAERVWLDTPTARCEAFLLEPASSGAPAPLVIFAHGNGELIDHWVNEFEPLRAAGAAVLLVEYPGYGRSSGTPSQGSIARAMTAAFDWAAARPGVDPQRITGWGRSLGGGAVCALARERPLAALVLESSFTSVRKVAAELFRVPGFLVRDAFDNLEVVRAFRGPILVLHGESDAAIPLAHARALQAAAARAELHVLPCGHNDCVRPWMVLEKFLLGRS
jgi:fermentation-respiration switch protein FrsA (DUF1100 family)